MLHRVVAERNCSSDVYLWFLPGSHLRSILVAILELVLSEVTNGGEHYSNQLVASHGHGLLNVKDPTKLWFSLTLKTAKYPWLKLYSSPWDPVSWCHHNPLRQVASTFFLAHIHLTSHLAPICPLQLFTLNRDFGLFSLSTWSRVFINWTSGYLHTCHITN